MRRKESGGEDMRGEKRKRGEVRGKERTEVGRKGWERKGEVKKRKDVRGDV